MFEDSIFESAGKQRTNSPKTVALSFLLQSIAVGIMVLIPLVYTEALPRRLLSSIMITPPPPPVQRTAPAPIQVRVQLQPVRQQQELIQPSAIPEHAVILHEEPLPPIPSGVVADQVSLGEYAAVTPLRLIVTPPPPPPPVALEPSRIGGDVMAARLIFQSKPPYPPLARQARIQGTVRLQALISKDGTIENLRVLSGHPLLLVPATLDAVKQWRYQPTMLNSAPVEVETTIDVTFTLGG